VRFRDFKSLSALEGQSHASTYLKMMVETGMVPTGTAVELLLEVKSSSITTFDHDAPSRIVAWDDVQRVDAEAPSNGRWFGMVLGLAADILSLAAYAWSYNATY